MKRVLFTIVLALMTMTMTGQVSKVELYKGLHQGMTKKEAMKELKQNRDTYKLIDFGNGVEWQVFKNKASLVLENNGLVGVHMIGAHNYGQDVRGAKAQRYLEQTAKVLTDKGYEVYLENENWKYPHLWEHNNYKYGLMLVNPEKTKVVHLYYTGTFIMASMTIKSYDQIQQEFKQYREDHEETVENLSGF